LGEVEATLFEGREQVTAYSLVLGRALLEAEYVLVALVVDAKRGDHGEGRDLDTVGQQGHDVEIERSLAISSWSATLVRATKRRDTEDLVVPLASRPSPTGSRPAG